jgi:hypothetical protein
MRGGGRSPESPEYVISVRLELKLQLGSQVGSAVRLGIPLTSLFRGEVCPMNGVYFSLTASPF